MTNKEAIEFLKNIIDSKAVTLIDNDFTARYHIDALQMAIKALENERPHGKWLLHGMIYYCSNCGHDCEQGGNNYCGKCGAAMREVDNE